MSANPINTTLNRSEIKITLKEITDLISVEHNKAMRTVDKLTLEASFGTVEKIATVYNDKGQTIPTYLLTKKQAIAVGAKLNNTLLMRLVDRLEEMEMKKPLTTTEQIVLLAQGHQEIEQRLSNTENKINYLENKSPILYNQIKVLEDKRKSRTNELVGYNPNCEKSKSNYSRTIRALTKKFKTTFGVARYADLPKDKYNDALKWVSNIEMVDLI
ncbi:ORF6C domain-containing protein [Aliarcobacter cryaerophilus]|uniref:ORF6C domain-containing protein n=1 Tax=Aliarcobacter cryaerophilus TaxID=28198 RepID=UPI0021B594C7|nr:ORF6C domain-containing protein [Aliarcobacter cryaerophilus]MCT7528794.1 ORF6C domain-containing protein [Aliarcobacter cryaerophilus]